VLNLFNKLIVHNSFGDVNTFFIRLFSDYDDFYIASKAETEEQVMIAGNVIKLVEDYLSRFS
jgi:hypothetical protein